jgi:chromosome segregation ATPase
MTTQDQGMPDLIRAEELGNQVRDALAGLARAKHDAGQDNARLKAELEALQARFAEGDAERQQQAVQLQRLQARLTQSVEEASVRAAETESVRLELKELADRSNESVRALHAANARADELARRQERQGAELAQSVARAGQLAAEIAELRTAGGALQGENEILRSGQRDLAQALIESARGDETLNELSGGLQPGGANERTRQLHDAVVQLAGRRRDLALRLERSGAEGRQLRDQLQQAEGRASELIGERDEIAASGKEVIAKLTQQRDARERELQSLRSEHETLGRRTLVQQARLMDGENAVRHFAESLASLAGEESAVAVADLPGIEDQRLELELTLSKLPQAGEEGVAQQSGLSMQLADGARVIAEALVARRRALSGALEAAGARRAQLEAETLQLRSEISAVRTTLEERDGALRRYQAELVAVRKEIGEQGQALAAKVQELSSTRSDALSARAELGVIQERTAELERRGQQLSGQVNDARRELERSRADHQAAQSRQQQAEDAQAQTVQALRSLTSRSDGSATLARALTEVDFSDSVSKAGQKLDLAAAQRGEQLASASMAYAQALRDRLTTLVDDAVAQRAELQAHSANEQQLHDEATSLKAALVDRDHEIENLGGEIARAKEEQAKVLASQLSLRGENDETSARLKQAQEALRLALAELDDFRARGMASSGHLNSDNERMRHELELLRVRIEKSEQEIAEASSTAEAAEARLRKQREEFTRRLEERDGVIQQKDRMLDQVVSDRVDAKSLEAQLHAVTEELAHANERLKEMEGVFGHSAGVTTRSGDLTRELKNVQLERDQLREKHRDLEAGLADAVSLSEQWRTQVEEKRKDVEALREKLSRELGEERERSQTQREEFRKLKEEVVGLRARLRRLTDQSV